jgi:translation initiation factor IF-2
MAEEPIQVIANITIREFAEKIGVPASEIQKVLMQMGVLAGLNQRLAPDAIQRIATKLGKNVAVVKPGEAATSVATSAPVATNTPVAAATTPVEATPVVATGAPLVPNPRKEAARAVAKAKIATGGIQSVSRPPVVTIMGHVDHGKTTLLDTIRKANVAKGEAGGITQHIGAYQVEHNGNRITFIDTPGHAAFSNMRKRGTSVTDIVIIVVAANDSVMPQTVEAIKTAKDAGVPIIVAINKVDLPEANVERVLTDLASRYDLVPEAYGGTVPTVNISAKAGTGIEDLLETIMLVAEIEVDPKADPHGKVMGTVIEAKIDKGRGPVTTVLIQQGTLRQGEVVVVGTTYGKVRGMGDERGNKLEKAGPSTPVEIIGLSSVPQAGDSLEVVRDEKIARQIAQERDTTIKEKRYNNVQRASLDDLMAQMKAGGPAKELNVVIKGDVQGSVQAIRDNLEELGNSEVRVRVLHGGVGPISESDIITASSDKDGEEKNTLVIGFNVSANRAIEEKAAKSHVTIKTYSIIYNLLDEVKEMMLNLLPPLFEEATLGTVEVRQLFRLPGGRTIAGCYVKEGSVKRNSRARLFRGKEQLTDAEIDTLKRFKDDQREVAEGYECGLTLSGYNDIIEGDRLEVYEMKQIPREL